MHTLTDMALLLLAMWGEQESTHDDDSPNVVLHPPEVVLGRLVAALAPEAVGWFTAHSHERGSAPNTSTSERAAALVELCEQALGAATSADLAAAGQALADVAALRAAIAGRTFSGVSLTLRHRCFFDAVAELRVPAEAGHAILVGVLPPATVFAPTLFAWPYPLPDMSVAYRDGGPFPLLTLKGHLESRVAGRGVEPRRQWLQQDGADADLFVWRRGQRDTEWTITTRMLATPTTVGSNDLRLTVVPMTGTQLVITTLRDIEGSPLATYVRAM